MTDYNFNNIDVHELLPQQDPFVMIDQLVHCDTTSTTTRFTVREDNIFAEQGLLNGCALAETWHRPVQPDSVLPTSTC